MSRAGSHDDARLWLRGWALGAAQVERKDKEGKTALDFAERKFAGREATFDVVVTDLESENQHFTVHPRFRIQNLSDPLRYGECSSIARACCKEGKCVHSQVHGGAC